MSVRVVKLKIHKAVALSVSVERADGDIVGLSKALNYSGPRRDELRGVPPSRSDQRT